jgi:hypothetical protein
MAAKPEPPDLASAEHTRWITDADQETRAAQPGYYWWHTYDGPTKFYWHEQDVTEAEYRAHADREGVEHLNEVVGEGSPQN